MPNRMQWNPALSVGNQMLDEQHRNIVAQCNALADCLAHPSEDGEPKFRKVFDQIMLQAREHYAAESALLARSGYPDLDGHEHEREEFDYLAAEIVTAENFDKDELHRFLALWWTGHIVGSAGQHRAVLEAQPVR